MMAKGLFVAICVISLSYTYAAETKSSIGTVSARGYINLDGYTILDNGTLFDGTAVQTGPVPAMLHLGSGTEINLSINSSGVVHSDRFVLTHGECQFKNANSHFAVEAVDLYVISGGPKSSGVVNLNPSSNALDRSNQEGQSIRDSKDTMLLVSALAGGLQVLDNAGLPVAQVDQGASTSFVRRGKTISQLSKTPGPPINPGPPPPQPPLLPPASR